MWFYLTFSMVLQKLSPTIDSQIESTPGRGPLPVSKLWLRSVNGRDLQN
jgi:hypothetical protein